MGDLLWFMPRDFPRYSGRAKVYSFDEYKIGHRIASEKHLGFMNRFLTNLLGPTAALLLTASPSQPYIEYIHREKEISYSQTHS